MKTLVTGATGFVGSAVLRHLFDANHEIRVLVRPDSDRRNLEGLPIEIVEGDLRDSLSLKQAVKNCSKLFHVAADYRLWIPNPEVMYETNVKGARELMLAAADAGIDKIIYTSSVATLGFNSDGSPADENTSSSFDDMVGHYKRSKFLAEQEIQNLVKQHDLPIIIVNPSTPIGPRDIKPTPTGRIVLDTLCGKMPAYVNTGLNVVHVDDVAKGHLLAYEHGQFGERYILGGENMSLKELLNLIDQITGNNTKRVRLPQHLILPIAWFMELWAKISKQEPRATLDGVRMSKKFMYFSSEKAKNELNYKPRPAIQAIEDAITWFKENNYYTQH